MTARIVNSLSPAARQHLAAMEKRWSGSIQLGMLATPCRKCVVTSKVLPTSLMVLLKAVHLPPPSPPSSAHSPSPSPASSSTPPSTAPSTTPSTAPAYPSAALAPRKRSDNTKSRAGEVKVVMLPDRILHPQYAPRKVGKGLWVTLDSRVWGHLQKRGMWKSLHPKASLPTGMEALLSRQLGERVVQEATLLAERFGGRKRLDFFTPTTTSSSCTEGEEEGAGRAFTILLHPRKAEAEGVLGPYPIFAPTFGDQDQADRFTAALRALTPDKAAGDAVAVKQSSVTAPLGIALYRLHLWCASIAREEAVVTGR